MYRKPRVFICSASETKQIMDDIEEELFRVGLCEVKRWDYHFEGGDFTLDALQRAVSEADFAVVILGQDDHTESRGSPTPSPRDNVIFEAGLFTSQLGVRRSFYIVDNRGTKIPSDWAGLTYYTYDVEASTPRNRVFSAASGIKQRIKEEWEWEKSSGRGRILGDWWQYVIRTDGDDDGTALSLFSVDEDGLGVRIHGYSVNDSGERLAQYRSQTASFDSYEGQLSYYWTGEHSRKGRSQYFGVGDVYLGRPDSPHAFVSGEYSVTNDEALQKTTIKFCNYARASKKEAELYRSTEASSTEKRELVEELLKQLEELRNGAKN